MKKVTFVGRQKWLFSWWRRWDSLRQKINLLPTRPRRRKQLSIVFFRKSKICSLLFESLPLYWAANTKNHPYGWFLCWWRRWDSNPLPLQCECSALPGELRPRITGLVPCFFKYQLSVVYDGPWAGISARGRRFSSLRSRCLYTGDSGYTRRLLYRDRYKALPSLPYRF